MGKYLDYYCSNNYKNLINLVDRIMITHFGWVPRKDYDDFYSIAGQVVWNCENKFNNSKNTSFKTYLRSCLIKKVKSRITYYNRHKRKLRDKVGNIIPDISINILTDDENGIELGDILADNTDLTEKMPIQDQLSENVQIYFSNLTKKQQQIALLIMKGYTPAEIQSVLHISSGKYQEQLDKMTSYKNVSVLRKDCV